MKRTRAERRADPDQWWRISGMGNESQVLPIGGGNEVYLKGDVQGATVVQISAELSQSMGPAVMEAVQESLKGAGIERAVILPAGVEFVRMEPVGPAKAKDLDRKMRVKEVSLEHDKKREGMH